MMFRVMDEQEERLRKVTHPKFHLFRRRQYALPRMLVSLPILP